MAVSFFTFLTIIYGIQVQAEQKSLKIGVQLPLTGDRAPVGKIIKNGIDMAVETLNHKGGVDEALLTVVYEDDLSTEQGAVEVAKKLTQDPQGVAIVGELFSRFVLASKDIVEKEGVPYLTGGTSPKTTENAKWIFRVGTSDALLTDLIARYVVETLKAKNLAVLHDSTGVHNTRAEMVVKVLQEKHGVTPAVRATWKPDDRDFKAQLEQVKTASVQAVIALGETGEGGPFLKQVKALGIEAPIIAHRDFGVKKVLDEAGEAAEGVLIIMEYVPALQEPERQEWARAYQERYGTVANVIAAQYYDAILLLAEAAKKGGPTRDGIRSGLEQMKEFKGVMSDYSFDETKNGVHRFYVVKIKEGKPTLETVLEGK
jgi:branched-chain amino acid transport system substrate-binding protein